MISLRAPRSPTDEDTAIIPLNGPPSMSKANRSRTFFPKSTFTMSNVLLFILLAAVLGIFYSFVASSPFLLTQQHVRRRQDTPINKHEQCGIFLAPSSIKGLDGYGIYSTRDIEEGASIFRESDGPSIPLVDANRGKWKETWNEYLWARGVSDQVTFLGDKVMDFQVGFGSLPNHSCMLKNLSHRYPNPAYDDSLVGRADPGAGAFSYSLGRDFYARKHIQAGDEIFLNYGYCKRSHRNSGHYWTSHIPMEEDYEEAANIAWQMFQLPKDSNLRITVPQGTDKFVAALLPQSTKHLHEMIGSTDIHSKDDLVPILAKSMTTIPRTPEWIISNGMCLEHLVARPSLLPHAGQGAFSQHFIRKDDIVVPAPMIQIADKDSLIVYNKDDKPVGWQLLLNYCFGHAESTLLLCPDTNALLINHCSNRSRECGSNGPNVSYRWSTGWEPRSDEWRQMSLDDIRKQTGRGLSMEFVALRDIGPGEEIYMDYGEEWENDWKKHVATWKPPVIDTFVTAKEANEQEELDLLVTGDLRKVSDHPYLFTGCQYWTSKEDSSSYYKKEYPNWEKMSDKDILYNFADSGRDYKGFNFEKHSDESYWPCSVLLKEKNGLYTVRIHQVDREEDTIWHENKLPRLLKHYPREAIHYFVKPYASDQTLPGVFRHAIGIRDDIFPEQWKNVKLEK